MSKWAKGRERIRRMNESEVDINTENQSDIKMYTPLNHSLFIVHFQNPAGGFVFNAKNVMFFLLGHTLLCFTGNLSLQKSCIKLFQVVIESCAKHQRRETSVIVSRWKRLTSRAQLCMVGEHTAFLQILSCMNSSDRSSMSDLKNFSLLSHYGICHP